MEIGNEDKIEKTHVGDPSVCEYEPDFDGIKPIVCGSALAGGESTCIVKVEEEEPKAEGKQSSSIEEEIGKVTLVGGLECGNSSSEESESESSSSSSTSSSSSSSDDDDEEEEEEEEENKENFKLEIEREVDGAYEHEEGEIRSIDGEMAVAGTNDDEEEEDEMEEILSALGIDSDEVDDDEDDAGPVRGPIKSKNELEVLPPVPPLDVTLQPHHQMLPVGVVLSIVGAKVIVEGREQHNPLNEGSVLWVTIDKSPLGLVDEIFGPVKNPFYVVRYNSESEVPAGIHEGTSVSFVLEFVNHVLNDKNLHKKGYDASGENDEELSDDTEFSDDEKEAEYKRMQRMTKRGMNGQKVGNQKSNRKKIKSKNGAWKNDRNLVQQTSTAVGRLPPNNQHNFSTVSASLDNHNCSSSVVGEQNFVGESGFIQPFSVMPQSSGIIATSNGVWTNGMPGQQPQNPLTELSRPGQYLNRFSTQDMPLLSHNYQQHPFPLPTPAMSIPTMMPYQQQQFNSSLSTLPNVVLTGGHSSLMAGQACAPWLGIAGQNGFSQTTFAMGMQGQQFLSALQGILTNGQMADGNFNLQPKGIQGNFETSQNFNMGASSSRGKKTYHRGHRGHGHGRGRGLGRGHGSFTG